MTDIKKITDVALGWMPEYKILNDNQIKLENEGRRLVQQYGSGAANGLDNYYHRLGMCEVGQRVGKGDIMAPTKGFSLGMLKEAYDIYNKSVVGDMPWSESMQDSYKDMKNNMEGLSWGLNNPYKDCRVWLSNLDWKNNIWKK